MLVPSTPEMGLMVSWQALSWDSVVWRLMVTLEFTINLHLGKLASREARGHPSWNSSLGDEAD